MKNNQSGRSMVEMLGVLAIIGVLSAGGLAGYSKAMFKHKLNSTMDQLTMLVTNIRTMYGTQESYRGLSVSQACNLGIIPQHSYQNGRMINPFKGEVEIQSASAINRVKDSAFIITLKGLPKGACVALATADWGRGYIGVKVNDGFWSAEFTGDPNEGSPYNMGNARYHCSDWSTVQLKFY